MAFRTIQKQFSAEIEKKRSRFIAYLCPISEFDELLATLQNEHRKATHHVTAFRRMNEGKQIVEGSKDDGEPAGTAGMPVLMTLRGANLIDVGMIIPRYFGGIKLGSGGLARAYSNVAKAAIEIAELHIWQRIVQTEVFATFADTAEMERKISNSGLTVISRNFVEEGAILTIEGPEDAIRPYLKDC